MLTQLSTVYQAIADELVKSGPPSATAPRTPRGVGAWRTIVVQVDHPDDSLVAQSAVTSRQPSSDDNFRTCQFDRRGSRRPGPHQCAGLAAAQALADVVIYDRAVSSLLRRARPDAEKIEAGAPAEGTMAQDALSMLIADKAREGLTVARLKWGDPFVFDSGGK